MRFLFILITNFFFLFNTVFSQQSSKIYGSINDEENNPLIGINIYNKENKTLGTVTNSEGKFEIEFLFEEPTSFVISGIGYEQNMIYVIVGDAKTQLSQLKEFGYGDPIVLDRDGNSGNLYLHNNIFMKTKDNYIGFNTYVNKDSNNRYILFIVMFIYLLL